MYVNTEINTGHLYAKSWKFYLFRFLDCEGVRMKFFPVCSPGFHLHPFTPGEWLLSAYLHSWVIGFFLVMGKTKATNFLRLIAFGLVIYSVYSWVSFLPLNFTSIFDNTFAGSMSLWSLVSCPFSGLMKN